jgi:hypothetical protein
MTDKPIFNGLLYSGMPDLLSLYKMPKITMINRGTGLSSNWPDPSGLPLDSWYDAWLYNYVAPSHKIIMFDHEAWLYDTQANRQTTANKYIELYTKMKQRRPDLRIGWYMDPIRRDFWNATKLISHADYIAWQGKNNDLGAIMAPYTDVFMPSLYFFYTRNIATEAGNINAVGMYVERNITETQRIRRVYGRLDSPIYPYLWWMKHNGSQELDIDVWELILRETLDTPTSADGAIIWGGWSLQWNESSLHWQSVKSRLTDKRRTI